MVLAMDSVVLTSSESASSTTAPSSEGSDSASSGLKLASVTSTAIEASTSCSTIGSSEKSVRCVWRTAVS